MSKIKITQVRSGIDRMARQKRTLVALGLRKMQQTVEVEGTAQILGMVKAVNHLVSAELEIAGKYEVLTPVSIQKELDRLSVSTK